ncbi:hypothetical protein ABK040_006507 [Willaertia magna]
MKRKEFHNNKRGDKLSIKERKITSHPLCQDFIEIVFKYLQPEDLYYTIPFVCSFWRNYLQKIENLLWKTYCPLNLLKLIKEDKYTNYKKLYLSLIGGEIYFKELFIFKLQKLTNQLYTLQHNYDKVDIFEKVTILTEKEKKSFIKNDNYYVNKLPYLEKMCQVDSDDENQELTEREKQLTFLQSTIIVNPSKPNITIEEDDDYRYPGRFFIKINFCNEITIIGLNGNCSNKFIYEGKIKIIIYLIKFLIIL